MEFWFIPAIFRLRQTLSSSVYSSPPLRLSLYGISLHFHSRLLAFVIFVKAPAYMPVSSALSKHRYFLTAFHIFLQKNNCRIYNTAVSYLQKPSALFYHSRPLISSPKVIIGVPSIVTRSPSPPLFHRILYSQPLYPALHRRAYPFSSFLLYATGR